MVGLRIVKRKRQVDADIVAAFASIQVANVSDVMNRVYGAPHSLKPMHDGTPLCGVAITVKTPPGDNLMVHKALDIAQPGDVIVVDSGGDMSNAIIGEMMVTHAITRKMGGIVIYGAIRDYDAIRSGSFPVFACGSIHRGPYKNGPGEINTTIALGGMVIEPGDLILGDGDGILSVPHDLAASILTRAQAKRDHEAEHVQNLRAGTGNRSWIDGKLRALGCEIEE